MEALEITDVSERKCAEIQIKRWSFIHQRQTYKDLLPFFGFYLQFQPQTASSVFNLTGGANEWINLRSLLIGFTILNGENNGTKHLRPAYKPSSFFQRMRVMAGSNVIAEIPDLNRYEAMMDLLQDDGMRNYTDNLGFGETFYNEGNRFLSFIDTNPAANTKVNISEDVFTFNFGGFKNKATVY